MFSYKSLPAGRQGGAIMRGIRFWIFLSIVSLTISLNAKVSSAQEESTITAQEPAAQIPATNEPDTQWLWGEVSSLDIPNNEITINYFDYETDTEKAMKINVDNNTKYENINSFSDIKLDDPISVDYALSPDGKYIAKNISIEKPGAEETPAPAASTTPPATP